MARVSMRVLVSVCDSEFHRGLNEQINIFTHTHAERERERERERKRETQAPAFWSGVGTKPSLGINSHLTCVYSVFHPSSLATVFFRIPSNLPLFIKSTRYLREGRRSAHRLRLIDVCHLPSRGRLAPNARTHSKAQARPSGCWRSPPSHHTALTLQIVLRVGHKPAVE